MPPKRVSSSKRQLDSLDSPPDAGAAERTAKKAKLAESNSQPTNTTLPAVISFPAKTENCIRIATWNVCGLAASQKKGFKSYIEAEDPDILVLTETKVNNEPVDPALTSRFPHRYWSISEKKTYSGTAVLSKIKPISVTKTLPGHPSPSIVKGRIVTLEFESCYLVATYVPNAGTGLKTLDVKKEWNVHFDRYIKDLDKTKPVIWTGDMNVAQTENDLSNAKSNWNKTPGYTEAETVAMKNMLCTPGDFKPQFIDAWRSLHPEDKHYTYFSYRFNCRGKGIGWRLDMFVISERIMSNVQACLIRDEIYGASDHCPVIMEFTAPI